MDKKEVAETFILKLKEVPPPPLKIHIKENPIQVAPEEVMK